MADSDERPPKVGDPGFDSRDINWRLIGFIAAVAVGVIFFLQNGQTTEIEFFFYTKEAKTRWLVIVCIAIGVAADRLFTLWWHRRKERKAKEG